LSRYIKGLRQKDIDPTERESIMAEMFKRVRPFLEQNITAAIERAEQKKKDDVKEAAEEAKRQQVLHSSSQLSRRRR
jgi:L-lactate utilization protein LutC